MKKKARSPILKGFGREFYTVFEVYRTAIIKKFWVTTENAVRIQISSAIIAYCLVAIVQHDLQLKRSTYEVLQILSISLMDKTPLVDLFKRTDFNNVKELDCPLFPGLFD